MKHKNIHINCELIADDSQLEALRQIEEDCSGCGKRRLKLTELINIAIRDELTEAERKAVELFWFKGLKVSETARYLGVSCATITKTLDRAKLRLFNALKYAVLYSLDLTDCPEITENASEIARNAELFIRRKLDGNKNPTEGAERS